MAARSEEHRPSGPAQAGLAPGVRPPGGGPARAIAWAIIPILFVGTSALDALHLPHGFGPPALVLLLNWAFLAGLPALVAVLVTRSFLARGDLGLLVLSGGVVVWALAAVAAGLAVLVDANVTVTIHNCGALAAGACQALAAGLLQGRTRIVARRRTAAAASWTLALAVVAGISALALAGALPVFFMDGAGGTPIRQVVLAAAIASFAAAAAALARGASRSAFRHWYALGLGLIATGLYAVLLQERFGGPVGWVGRIAQYLGGLAMLVATAASVRESGAWALPLGAVLRQTEARYRTLFEHMSEGFVLAEVAAPGPVPRLTVIELNPAAEALLGRARGAAVGTALSELTSTLGLETLAVEACARVLRTGAPARFAGSTPDGARHLAVVAFAAGRGQLALLLSEDSERRRAELALVEANARLTDTDRHRSRFLALLSHELRNPLAPIRNAAATLGRAAPGSPEAHRAVQILSRQVEQLTRLVDELLDLTRISSGKIRLQRSELDLGELVHRAGEDRRDSFASRGIHFSVEIPGERLRASGDPTRLGQVIGNLLQNAAKFTPAGGAVTLALARAGGEAELRVRDSGVGIEPSLLARLFDPFVQGEATLARAEGGLGLGLALVKGLVELHCGSIQVRSDGTGRGTEVIVRLPALPAEADPATAPAPAGTSPAAP